MFDNMEQYQKNSGKLKESSTDITNYLYEKYNNGKLNWVTALGTELNIINFSKSQLMDTYLDISCKCPTNVNLLVIMNILHIEWRKRP